MTELVADRHVAGAIDAGLLDEWIDLTHDRGEGPPAGRVADLDTPLRQDAEALIAHLAFSQSGLALDCPSVCPDEAEIAHWLRRHVDCLCAAGPRARVDLLMRPLGSVLPDAPSDRELRRWTASVRENLIESGIVVRRGDPAGAHRCGALETPLGIAILVHGEPAGALAESDAFIAAAAAALRRTAEVTGCSSPCEIEIVSLLAGRRHEHLRRAAGA